MNKIELLYGSGILIFVLVIRSIETKRVGMGRRFYFLGHKLHNHLIQNLKLGTLKAQFGYKFCFVLSTPVVFWKYVFEKEIV